MSLHRTARYVLHLKEAYSMPLAQAYSSAVAQFRTLKATLEGASRMAQLEAEAYGAQFGPGRIGAGAKAEEKMLDLWDAQHGLSTTSTSDSGASSSSASFASIMAGAGAGDQPPKTFGWTGGKAYLRPGALSQSSTANTTHTSATNASLAEEPQTSESVLDAVHLMDVLGGTSSGGGPAPQSQEAKDKALHQNIQAKAKQKQRATARKITQMVCPFPSSFPFPLSTFEVHVSSSFVLFAGRCQAVDACRARQGEHPSWHANWENHASVPESTLLTGSIVSIENIACSCLDNEACCIPDNTPRHKHACLSFNELDSARTLRRSALAVLPLPEANWWTPRTTIMPVLSLV